MNVELETIIQQMNDLEDQKDDVEGMVQALNSDLEDISLEIASIREHIYKLEERISAQEWEDDDVLKEEDTETDL